jgi:uncharacterized GH25 family protein
MNKTKLILIIFLAVSFIMPAGLFAHDVWIYPVDKSPVINKTFAFKLQSDHVFPAQNKEVVNEKKLPETFILNPAGKKILTRQTNPGIFESYEKLPQKGTYLVVSGKKGTFWAKTTSGSKEDADKSLKGALKVTYSIKFSKAVISVGASGGVIYAKTLGHDLEIIPLKDPGTLKAGESLPVRVLLKGKPFIGDINATYEGFSTGENQFALSQKTNGNGEAAFTMSKSGTWLVVVSYRGPYVDKKKADENLYAATLTFIIK